MSNAISQLQMPDPILRRLRPSPPFPLRFLKGQPVFWDDFESHIAGFVQQDKGSPGLNNAIANTGNSRSGWTWGDGSEYGCYITSEASKSGRQSLRLGGGASDGVGVYSAQVDDLIQDVSVGVSVPSEIIGIEFDIAFGGVLGPTNGPLLSIEYSKFLSTTQDIYVELQAILAPNRWTTASGYVTPCIVLNPSVSPIFILTGNTVNSPAVATPDTNGIFLPNNPLTNPTPYSTDVFAKGAGTAWHRMAVIADMRPSVNKFLDIFLEGYYNNCRSISGNIPKQTTYNTGGLPAFAEEVGLFRVELHNGDQTYPYYLDNFVVTDEGGFVTP